ncbi:outer membrane lipoprotein-sorting protein [Desulfobacter curvatus]|uniref:outer membrane lipoprotein-sorting protein n=1 Tax=Desulfobacter curvatus TaxID=2290 RepID=UPI00039BF7B2|nr:outer membrane lipoprotein-sorting protein [Desulfobacter curvatus]
MKRNGLILLMCFVSLFLMSLHLMAISHAGEPLTAEWVAQQVFDRDRGHSSRSTVQMVLIDKNNSKRGRTFTNIRIVKNGFEKQLIRFVSPEDIEGTGFLTIETDGYNTEQFIFLSALGRSRRIVSSQKHHRFVQSDFTYEDMERHPVGNYKYNLAGQKTINNMPCYLLETRPKIGTESQYAFIRSVVTKEGFVPIIVEYFDQEGTQIKTYQVIKLEKIQDIWTEKIAVMKNLIENHQTFIKIDKIEYNISISENQFSKKALENY